MRSKFNDPSGYIGVNGAAMSPFIGDCLIDF
jgi:hypothetical protein